MSDKPAPHPAPWRWDYSVLRDANDLAILVLSDEGEAPYLPEDMRTLIAAAPEMHLALNFALDVIREAVDDGWRPKSLDIGPGCVKARALLARIAEAAKGA